MRERRLVKGSTVRASNSEGTAIDGYAAVFGDKYDAGYFIETIKRGAFSRAIKEKQDVRMLLNHDANNLLGRSTAGTLNLMQDNSGLHFDCTMPDTQLGKDVRTLIDRGDLSGCSFAFSVTKQSWRDEKDVKTGQVTHYREIEDLDLYDVSVVTFPAYEGTSVDISRSMFPEGIPAEVRSHVPELREVPDLGGNGDKEPDGDEMCECNCEACSGCTGMRSAHHVEEKRDENIAALVTALKEVSRLAALIPELEKKQAPIADTAPILTVPPEALGIPVESSMSVDQAKAHVDTLRASLSL